MRKLVYIGNGNKYLIYGNLYEYLDNEELITEDRLLILCNDNFYRWAFRKNFIPLSTHIEIIIDKHLN